MGKKGGRKKGGTAPNTPKFDEKPSTEEVLASRSEIDSCKYAHTVRKYIL